MIDIELNDERKASPAPRKKKGENFSLPPKPTEADLYRELRNARDALYCGDLRMTAYAAYQVASIYANMGDAVASVVAADLPGIPSPLGDWSGAAFVVWTVDWVIRNEGRHPVYHLPETGEHCPERSTLIHDR